MRPEARLLCGHFPCPPAAIDQLLRRLKLDCDPSKTSLLDPCCGEATAVKQLAEGLGIPEDRTWLIELDVKRGETSRATMPGAAVLSPCSFLSTKIRAWCYSLVYCNPPFDDSAAAGKRVEELFLSHAVHLVADDGILVFVCPEPVTQRPFFRETLLRDFGEISVMEWPSQVRKYQEVFVIARRRGKASNDRQGFKLESDGEAPNWHTEFRRRLGIYPVPEAKGPGQRFLKAGYTDEEVQDLLDKSPLKNHLRIIPDYQLPSPPLSLGVGHLALLLSAGHLDGLVTDAHGEPHVVRGTAKKVVEVTDEQVEKTKSATTTVRTETERIKLAVRAVWPDGIIHTLGEEKLSEQE